MPSIPTPDLDFNDLEAVKKVVDALAGFDSGQQERILRWAREKLGLADLSPATVPLPAAPPPATPADANLPTDIKSFYQSKKPSSDTQFAALVAYYYRFIAPPAEQKEGIKAEDLQEACRLVERDRFPRPAQTLVNAHAQGLLDRPETGTYVINTVGENLVAIALPSDGSASPLRGNKRPARKAARTSSKSAAKRSSTKRPATRKRAR